MLALGERPELGLEAGQSAKAKSAPAGESFARKIASLENVAEFLEPAAEVLGVEGAGDRLRAHPVIISSIMRLS